MFAFDLLRRKLGTLNFLNYKLEQETLALPFIRKVDGVSIQGFRYQSQPCSEHGRRINLAVELEGIRNVTAGFVYMSKASVPGYIVKNGMTYLSFSAHLGRSQENSTREAEKQRILLHPPSPLLPFTVSPFTLSLLPAHRIRWHAFALLATRIGTAVQYAAFEIDTDPKHVAFTPIFLHIKFVATYF